MKEKCSKFVEKERQVVEKEVNKLYGPTLTLLKTGRINGPLTREVS